VTSQAESFLAIGALLTRARNLDDASRAMSRYVLDPSESNLAGLAAVGVNTDQARDFLPLLPALPEERQRQCELAHAWALGRLSPPKPPTWQPVITTGEVAAEGIDRLTAETMIGLIVGARASLRIFSPFLDARGIAVLTFPIVAATRRRVQVSIGYARRGNRGMAIEQLKEEVDEDGAPAHFRAVAIETNRPFPHLKLIASDGSRAYIGSANLTWPALTSNAEIGALVEGEPVRTLERWFDGLLDHGSTFGQPTPATVDGLAD
jgi:phosphatidylserine/phosphatidylglycerophosphate/cardiolipin synthase-like enzyme